MNGNELKNAESPSPFYFARFPNENKMQKILAESPYIVSPAHVFTEMNLKMLPRPA
jgi:hypothetical protein